VQMGPPQGRAEGEENLPHPAAHCPLDAPQDPNPARVQGGTGARCHEPVAGSGWLTTSKEALVP